MSILLTWIHQITSSLVDVLCPIQPFLCPGHVYAAHASCISPCASQPASRRGVVCHYGGPFVSSAPADSARRAPIVCAARPPLPNGLDSGFVRLRGQVFAGEIGHRTGLGAALMGVGTCGLCMQLCGWVVRGTRLETARRRQLAG